MNNMSRILHPRLQQEGKTIRAMVRIYCRAQHGSGKRELCQSCREIVDYAEKRLAHCPFNENKPTCGNCTVHCYKPVFREQIRRIMRFAGPRMLWHHPLMAFRHLLDGRQPAPLLPKAHSGQPSLAKESTRKRS